MNECKLKEVDIIEIGGGYGGLCFYLYKLSHIFDIIIKTYSIFDLEYPLKLQKKYLEFNNMNNVQYLQLQDDNLNDKVKINSYLISNYAYSEIPLEIQKEYTDKVLNPYVSHGFLTWNMINIYQFINYKRVTIEREYPSTCYNNFYIKFTPR